MTSYSPLASIGRGVALCPEDRKAEGIVEDLTVRENIVLAVQAGRGWRHHLSLAEQYEIADRYIELLRIATPSPDQPVRTLSGGNQQKVILARWLATNPQILILDEPTRGIDIGAKAEVQRLVLALAEEGRSCVFISSELDEVLRTSHRIVVLRDQAKVNEFDGEVDEHRLMQAIAGVGAWPGVAARRSGAASRRAGSSSRSAALGVILLFDLIFEPGFFSLQIIDGHLYGSIVDVLRNGVPVMLLAIGMTLVIATGGIDLSVGAVMAISASVATLLINPDLRAFITDPSYSVTPLPLVLVDHAARRRSCAGSGTGCWSPSRGIQPMVATLILMIAGPRHRPAAHERRPDPDLLRAVRVHRQRLGLPAVLAVRSCVVFFALAWTVTRDDVARDVHRVRRHQRPIELLQRHQREAGQALRLHVLRLLRRRWRASSPAPTSGRRTPTRSA